MKRMCNMFEVLRWAENVRLRREQEQATLIVHRERVDRDLPQAVLHSGRVKEELRQACEV